MKKTFYSEAAYFIGLAVLAIGTAWMEKAGFGMSMVVAPAYIVHLKLSQFLPFFSFGMAEYCLQALLILGIIALRRRFRPAYLFSFVTAVLYGLMLDGSLWLMNLVPADAMALRLLFYFAGMLACAAGVSLLFRTYISPEAYELFVKEISAQYGFTLHRCKTAYDCVSCLVSIALSFCFFGLGEFRGIHLGTVFCALVNGWLIGRCDAFWQKHFQFADRFSARSIFE